MTVEELATVVMGELGYINFELIILIVALIATVIFMVRKLNSLNEQLYSIRQELRYIQRHLK